MNDNPSSVDLVKIGWCDWTNILIIARSEDILLAFLKEAWHFFERTNHEEGKQVAYCDVYDDSIVLYLNDVLEKVNDIGSKNLSLREWSFLENVKYYYSK
jgi:hypothetical protein